MKRISSAGVVVIFQTRKCHSATDISNSEILGWINHLFLTWCNGNCVGADLLSTYHSDVTDTKEKAYKSPKSTFNIVFLSGPVLSNKWSLNIKTPLNKCFPQLFSSDTLFSVSPPRAWAEHGMIPCGVFNLWMSLFWCKRKVHNIHQYMITLSWSTGFFFTCTNNCGFGSVLKARQKNYLPLFLLKEADRQQLCGLISNLIHKHK